MTARLRRRGRRDRDRAHPEPAARLRDPDQVLRQHQGDAEGRRRHHDRAADRRRLADHADDDGHHDHHRPQHGQGQAHPRAGRHRALHLHGLAARPGRGPHPLRRLLGREAPGREGDLHLARQIGRAGGHGGDRRGRHRPLDLAPGRHRPGDGLQLLQFRDHQLPDRRQPSAARRRARAQGAEPRHRPRGDGRHHPEQGRGAGDPVRRAGDQRLQSGPEALALRSRRRPRRCWPRPRPTACRSTRRSRSSAGGASMPA